LPSSSACKIAQPGSWRCEQSRNLHRPIKGLNSINPSSTSSSSICHKPNSRIPGESIKCPPPGKCNRDALVVVWVPCCLSDKSPTRKFDSGSSAFTSEDFPTPDWPTNTLV